MQVLTFSAEPLRSPLLPLQYGEASAPGGPRVYGSLQDEAAKISNSLCPADPMRVLPRHGLPSNPVELIKNIVQVR